MAWLQNTILWNSIVVTLLGTLVYLLGRTRYFQSRPALVHFLWLVVLAKLVTPSLIPVPVSMWSEPATVTVPTPFIQSVTLGSPVDSEPQLDFSREASGTSTTVHLAEVGETIRPAAPAALQAFRFPDLQRLLFPLFLLGSVSGTVMILIWWRVRTLRTIRYLEKLAARDEALTKQARDLATKMHRPVDLSVSTIESAIPPFLWFKAGRPEIYLPAEVARNMDADQLDCILSHELAHYFRRDRWSNCFAFSVAAFCWWHPVAWLAVGQLRQLQEISCDAEVVTCSAGKRRLYAETLLRVLELIDPSPAASPSLASSFGQSAFVNRRFKMLASTRLQPRSSRLAIVSLSLAALSLLCFPVRGIEPAVETPSVPGSTERVQVGAGLRVAVPASGENIAAPMPDPFTAVKPESSKPDAAFATPTPGTPAAAEDNLFRGEVVTESSLKERSRKNLEKLFGALQKYNAEHQHFPTPVIWGKDGTGKYPHSWRVAILPYLGEEALYREYDFDQAWDSPQNRTVLALMPEVFRNPKGNPNDFSTGSAYYVFVERVLNQPEGSLIFQRNLGNHSSLEQLKPLTPFCARNGITIPEITDGLSNTIAIVETAADIPWTKPLDVPFTKQGELPYLGAIHQAGISVITFDGHVHLLPYLIKPEALRSMVTHADGEPFDVSKLQASSFDPAEIWIRGYELKRGSGPTSAKPDLSTMVNLIMNQVEPNSWKLNNPDGIGQIGIDREGNRIVVRHTAAVHEKLRHRFRDAGW